MSCRNNHRRREPALALVFAAVALFAIFESLEAGSQTARETRIVFKRGASEADAQGKLMAMNDELRFVVRARAKQHMLLAVDASGPTRGFVTFPNGEEVGSPGSVFFDDTLPDDGDYRIRITESAMGEEWHGSVTLHVQIR